MPRVMAHRYLLRRLLQLKNGLIRRRFGTPHKYFATVDDRLRSGSISSGSLLIGQLVIAGSPSSREVILLSRA